MRVDSKFFAQVFSHEQGHNREDLRQSRMLLYSLAHTQPKTDATEPATQPIATSFGDFLFSLLIRHFLIVASVVSSKKQSH
jgi:hypothetical protein